MSLRGADEEIRRSHATIGPVGSAPSRLRASGKVGAVALAVVLASFCFYYQTVHPPCCDAPRYVKIGERLADSGVSDQVLGNVRLYGYPLLIAALVKPARALSVSTVFLLFIAQLLLYLCAVYLVSRAVALYSSRIHGDITFYALVGNVLIYPYLAISLSDGVSSTLLVLIATVILWIFIEERSPRGTLRRAGLRLFVFGFLVGFAILVRPANLHLIALIVIVVAVFAWQRRIRRGIASATAALAATAGFLVAVGPQMIYNYSGQRVIGFLPGGALGDKQVAWGITNLKYATNLSGGPLQLQYLNPWIDGADRSLSWYFTHGMAGVKTGLVHIFAALDFDYFFPYIYDLDPWYQGPLFVLSHSIVFWGVVGCLLVALALGSGPGKGLADKPRRETKLALVLLVSLYGGFLSGWTAVHSVAAVENRFALPVVTVLLPLAAWALVVSIRDAKRKLGVHLAFVLYLAGAWRLSVFLDGLKSIRC